MSSLSSIKRAMGRKNDELRTVGLFPHYYKHSDGSCFVKFGDTHVICAATIEEKVPLFLRYSKTGWITAEYGLLPCSCSERTEREAAKGRQSGRTLEIQRLISRSLRAIVDLSLLGERQIKIDCDVIQADGGTRTASITGGFVALYIACQKLLKSRAIKENPIKENVAAISCGLLRENALLDLDYSEDSHADVDANFVMSPSNIIEIQISGEKRPFSEKEFNELFTLARSGCAELIAKQNEVLGINN